ncbi:GNAT family N-acetyltransferase [Sphingomonas hylomeconis]|uniref:GNAT family N-acetyltransferase n=1 Tax=Sphingomonas hylomeconis TaxID=1395958 RepID=A0ABV7T128_9SPHN|nr:GNAT family N-acetyltransferase [Sphingomonas hylomeconis]
MNAVSLPLKFQIGARTVASIRRHLQRVPLDLAAVIAGAVPALPPLDAAAHGYHITSLPEDRLAAISAARPGMIAFVRQRYTRYFADLTLGYEAYLATMSSNTRSSLKRKAKKVAATSGGALDVRRFRTPAEMTAFHTVARQISATTYQEKLLGAGLPADAAFVQRMAALAAADAVRGWLLYVGEAPAAYLYCPIEAGTVRYDYLGHDPAFNDLSPGGVLQLEAMRDLCGAPGLARFDFTEGEGQHKRQFSTGGVACVDVLLLRASPGNRLTMLALATFDRGTALAKRGVQRFGLGDWAKKIRRA